MNSTQSLHRSWIWIRLSVPWILILVWPKLNLNLCRKVDTHPIVSVVNSTQSLHRSWVWISSSIPWILILVWLKLNLNLCRKVDSRPTESVANLTLSPNRSWHIALSKLSFQYLFRETDTQPALSIANPRLSVHYVSLTNPKPTYCSDQWGRMTCSTCSNSTNQIHWIALCKISLVSIVVRDGCRCWVSLIIVFRVFIFSQIVHDFIFHTNHTNLFMLFFLRTTVTHLFINYLYQGDWFRWDRSVDTIIWSTWIRNIFNMNQIGSHTERIASSKFIKKWVSLHFRFVQKSAKRATYAISEMYTIKNKINEPYPCIVKFEKSYCNTFCSFLTASFGSGSVRFDGKTAELDGSESPPETNLDFGPSRAIFQAQQNVCSH